MFGAMFRWIRAVGYLLTGQIDSARRTLDTNPHVVQAKYDEVLRQQTDRIQQYKQAVSGLIAQQEKKLASLRKLTEEVDNLERLKAGALAKAKERVAKLAGKSQEEIKQDGEYLKCLNAYNDFSSTLAEKQARINELEQDIQEYEGRINEHKVQLQHLVREIEKTRVEASDAVADMISAGQEKEVADALSGIAQDGTAKELENLRNLRREVKAEARISKELAGTDARAQEAEFLEYARRTSSNSEFDQLIGLAAKTEAGSPAAAEKSRNAALPE